MPGRTLTDLVRPEHTALVLVELQRGVVGPAAVFPQLKAAADEIGVVANAGRLATAGRAARVPVIHATAQNLAGGFGANRNARLFAAARSAGGDLSPESDAVRPVPGVGPEDGDLVLPRLHGLSPMTGGPLDSLLRNAGVGTVVLVGLSLNIAVTNLAFDAVNRSYQVVIPTDAVAGVPAQYGRAVLEHTLSTLATLTTTEALMASWEAAG